jgi:hypothetical protein
MRANSADSWLREVILSTKTLQHHTRNVESDRVW